MLFNILHLSDIHFKEQDAHSIKKLFLKLNDDLESLGSIERPSHLFISGDISFQASPVEFEGVLECILKLADDQEIDYENIIIAPGNHDISRNNVGDEQELISSLEQQTFKETEILINGSIDKYLKRLENFNEYLEIFQSNNLVESNGLCRTYKYLIESTTVGISCFNTCFTAVGGDEDYGKLYFNKKQISTSLDLLENCEYKVALMHHPFEWFNESERYDVKRIIFNNYDLLILGHTHVADSTKSIISKDINIVVSNGGCFFPGDISTNLHPRYYSLISIDFNTKKVKSHYRKYYEKRDEFDKSLDDVANGVKVFELSENKQVDNSIIISQNFMSIANDSLLTNSLDTQAPKDILEIFVEPAITEKPEEVENYYDEDVINVGNTSHKKQKIDYRDLVNTDEDFFLIGEEESGRTTLLFYLIAILNKSNKINNKIGIYINHKNMIDTRSNIRREVMTYSNELGIDLKVDDGLLNGNFAIFIDDYNIDYELKNKKISKFMEKYNKNKFFIVCANRIDLKFDVLQLPFTMQKLKPLYINKFSLKNTRKLIKQWFRFSENMKDMDIEEIFKSLESINIPLSPVTLSLILWIFEKSHDLVLVNKSALISNYIDLILEKSEMNKKSYIAIDFRNREHYLSSLAKYMAHQNQYMIRYNDLAQFTLNYFDEMGIPFNLSEFISYFIDRGILKKNNDFLEFKMSCVCKYFIALSMMDDDDLYNYVLDRKRYLLYSDEIEYLTGMKRNNYDIVEIIYTYCNEFIEKLENNISSLKISLLEDVRIEQNLLEINDKHNLNSNNLLDLLGEYHESLDYQEINDHCQELNEISENIRERENKKKTQQIDRKLKNDVNNKFYENLKLISVVLRNLELIEKSKKEKMLESVIELWIKYAIYLVFYIGDLNEDFVKYFALSMPEIGDTTDFEEEISEMGEILVTTIKGMVPHMVLELMDGYLYSGKFENIINSICSNSSKNMIKVFASLLFLNSSSRYRFDFVEQLLKDNRYDKYVSNMIFNRTIVYYLSKVEGEKEERDFVEFFRKVLDQDTINARTNSQTKFQKDQLNRSQVDKKINALRQLKRRIKPEYM